MNLTVRKAVSIFFAALTMNASYLFGTAIFGDPADVPHADDVETVTGDPAAPLMEKHRDDCWTKDEAPKADLPAAAIVQFNDGRTVYSTKRSLVSAAFSEVLDNAGYGGEQSDRIDPIALCI